HHRSAKTGTERINPVAYQRLSDDSVGVFASKGGAPTNPDWFHNVVANPHVTVELGTEWVLDLEAATKDDPHLVTTRRYRHAESGAKTAMIASVQSSATQTLFPAGMPRNSARAALTIFVNGLCSAIGCSQLGIVWTGTNADETNVTGNRIVNPNAFAASGEDDESPMKANTHEKA